MTKLYLILTFICSTVAATAQTKETAVLFSGVDLDESYLLADKVSVVFGEDGNASISLDGVKQTKIVFDATNPVTAQFKDAFNLKANQDPDHTGNYYSTFYSNDGAYKLPATAKAYVGEVTTDKTTGVLNLTETELIHKSEPVILKATSGTITLMPSANTKAASTDNELKGTDAAKTLSTNDYALSLGQKGVGFYLWEGKTIGANKAYLTLDGTGYINSLTFQFDDYGVTAIDTNYKSRNTDSDGVMYNLNGMRVDSSYKGIVIRNGKKIFNK